MAAASGVIYRFDRFVLDLDRGVLTDRGAELQLRPKSFHLLGYFFRNAGRVIGRDEIMQAIWPDVTVSDDSISQCIKEIRRILGDEQHQVLRTLPRRGYQFVGPVDAGEQLPSPAPARPQVNDKSEALHAGSAPSEQSRTSVRAEPHRRQMTILVCELTYEADTNFDVEDLHAVLGKFQHDLNEIVIRRKGHINKRVGNAVIAQFGFPEAHEDDAEQAVLAGLDICRRYQQPAPTGEPEANCRVGIATGLVIADGDPQSGAAAGELFGEAPTLAGRLQGHAEPGMVVIDRTTRDLIGRLFEYRELQPIGKSASGGPTKAWQVTGASTVDSRFEALRERLSMSLIGRDEELALLHRRWAQASSGEGRVVVLSGEPGIGKSRIADTMVERLRDERHALMRFSCSPQHTNTALYPFLVQLERSLSIAPGDDSATKIRKLEVLFAHPRQEEKGAQQMAVVAELLTLPPSASVPSALSPQQKLEVAFDTLLQRLADLAIREPVLVVFEDAHWIDPTSLDLLDRAVALIGELPVLMVLTCRSEFQPSWLGQPHVTSLPLNRLGRRDSAAIIAGVTGGKALPDALIEQILSRTDGVPLFIEELTSSLLESDLLRQSDGKIVLKAARAPLAVPTSLQASLVARLDRLGSIKDVAQIAAAIGREFNYELVASVADLPTEDLNTALERLTENGIISRRGSPPASVYTFKHALVQEAAYSTMLKSRRRQLHSAIAKALIEKFPEVSGRLPEVVAHQFAEAGLAGDAVGYWIRAGRMALARSANREAVVFFERALQLLKSLPESQSTLEQCHDLLLEMRPALTLLLEPRRALECLHEAEEFATRLKDERRRGHVNALKSSTLALLGELDEALVTGARAREIALTLGDLRLRVLATSQLCYAHYINGDYAQAIDLATGNIAALPADWVHETLGLSGPPSVWDRTWLVLSLAELGRFAEAARHHAEATRIAEATQHAFTRCLAHFAGGLLFILKGDWAQARPLIESWIAVSKSANFTNHPWGASTLAWTLSQLGETTLARDRFQEGAKLLELPSANRSLVQRLWGHHAMAHSALRLGLLNEACRQAERGLAASEGYSGFSARALQMLGEIAASFERFEPDVAVARFRSALALAEPRGMLPLIAQCHFGLGTVHQRMSEQKKASKHLTAAKRILREMDTAPATEQTVAAEATAPKIPQKKRSLGCELINSEP